MIDRTLQNHVKTAYEIKAQIDVLTAKYNKEKDIITGELKSRESEDFTAGAYKAHYKEYDKTRLDTKALKANEIDIYNKYLVSSHTSTFKVATV